MHFHYVSSFTIRLAIIEDIDAIMLIRYQASLRLKNDGVDQWQGIEPSIETFLKDIQNNECYVMVNDRQHVISMASLCLSKEIAYQELVDLEINAMTIHRIAIHDDFVAKKLTDMWFHFFENQAKLHHLSRIYIDTHPNNFKMLSLLNKHHFTYIGEFEFQHLPSPLRRLFMKTILS